MCACSAHGGRRMHLRLCIQICAPPRRHDAVETNSRDPERPRVLPQHHCAALAMRRPDQSQNTHACASTCVRHTPTQQHHCTWPDSQTNTKSVQGVRCISSAVPAKAAAISPTEGPVGTVECIWKRNQSLRRHWRLYTCPPPTQRKDLATKKGGGEGKEEAKVARVRCRSFTLAAPAAAPRRAGCRAQ